MLFFVSQSFAQKLAGTYYVNNNPKNIVKIILNKRNNSYGIIAQNWEGIIEDYDHKQGTFISSWQYSLKTKEEKLKGLSGEHSAVIDKNGIITVQILPFDARIKAGVVKWYPAN